jgi:threonine dehydrogenase-like Zn-dependent dehydrogenase
MFAIAARIESTEPHLVEMPEPAAPAERQVLCRTLQLGVCGTDREILHSAAPLVPPDCDFLALGHECLGRVEMAGPGVSELSVGDLVVPVVRRAFPNQRHRVDLLAFGTFTERGIVREHGFSPSWCSALDWATMPGPTSRRACW